MSDKFAGQLAKIDQAGALLADALPPVMWRYYQSLLACGFKEDQAIKLTEGLQAMLMNMRRKAD